MSERIRTIITQDAEVDDQNSLRHFLLCSNEVELQGIVQTSSVFHWEGVPGAVTIEDCGDSENAFARKDPEAKFDQPYRWTGTQWMMKEIAEYEEIYPNLIKHAEGYPSPDYLRSITVTGNIGYCGDVEHPTAGS